MADADLTLALGGEEYALRRDGDDLRIGVVTGGETRWLDDAVSVSALSEPARAALERGDTGDGALRLALEGVVRAEVDRGA